MSNTSISQQVKAATLQAQALAQLFAVDLTQAQDVLAQVAYDCDHWQDLQDRIQKKLLGATQRTLLRVAKDQQARHDFEQWLDGILERFARAVRTDHLGPIQLRSGVYKAFAATEKAFTLPELFPVIDMPVWRNANIGPEPDAILTADVDIDGQAFRLLAFRTCREPFTTDKSDLGRCINDIPVSGHIVWADYKQWERAIRQYEECDDQAHKPNYPKQILNDVMNNFETWFEELREYVSDVLLGTGDTGLVMPLLIKGVPYVVVGFPITLDDEGGSGQPSVQYPRIVCIDGFPLLIDKARVPSQQNSPDHALFDQMALSDDEGMKVFARSASLVDIEFVLDLRYRPEFLRQDESVYEWSSATASPQLAMDIIEKVARHGVVQSQSATEIEVVFDKPIVEVGQGSRFYVLVGGSHDNRKPTALWIRAEPEGEDGDSQPVKRFVVDQGFWEAMQLSWGNMDERRKQWLDWSQSARV